MTEEPSSDGQKIRVGHVFHSLFSPIDQSIATVGSKHNAWLWLSTWIRRRVFGSVWYDPITILCHGGWYHGGPSGDGILQRLRFQTWCNGPSCGSPIRPFGWWHCHVGGCGATMQSQNTVYHRTGDYASSRWEYSCRSIRVVHLGPGVLLPSCFDYQSGTPVWHPSVSHPTQKRTSIWILYKGICDLGSHF